MPALLDPSLISLSREKKRKPPIMASMVRATCSASLLSLRFSVNRMRTPSSLPRSRPSEPRPDSTWAEARRMVSEQR